MTAVNTVTGIVTRSNDGTQGAISNVSYTTSYLQGGFWLGGMRNDVVFGGDAQYRKIYRNDLIRQATPNVFNIYNPVYGLLKPGYDGVSHRQRPDRQARRSDRCSSRTRFHLTDRFALVGGARFKEYDQYAGRGRPFKANTDLSGRQGAAARRRHRQAHR